MLASPRRPDRLADTKLMGEKLRKLRGHVGLTLAEVGYWVDLRVDEVIAAERGDLPGDESLLLMVRVLGGFLATSSTRPSEAVRAYEALASAAGVPEPLDALCPMPQGW